MGGLRGGGGNARLGCIAGRCLVCRGENQDKPEAPLLVGDAEGTRVPQS